MVSQSNRLRIPPSAAPEVKDIPVSGAEGAHRGRVRIYYNGGRIMSTTMPKAGEVSRNWYILDATDKPLGRVAAQAAVLLRGKHKPTFAPHVDCGDHVIIINCEKAILTGKKLEQKKFYWHTGWIGGLKEVSYKKLMAERPEKAMTIAVTGMLPHNAQGAQQAKRLRTFKGAEHKHAAQKPEVYEF